MLHFKQSPINITTIECQRSNLTANFFYTNEEFHVFDNGLNISLMPTNGSSYVIKNNKRYNLSEMHFHRPSEHQVDDKQFDMELHLVHQEDHETLVYSILLKIEDDGYDFSKPFNNIDSNITIDLTKLIPSHCWDYHGSFTTSPFDEEVIWLINKQESTICSSQAALINGYYPNNNRCLQPLNNRQVYSICACKGNMI